jgi:hypothetical protein
VESAREVFEALRPWDRGLKDSWKAHEVNANAINVEGFID